MNKIVDKVISISVPEYIISEKPNYLSIGKKVDRFLEKKLGYGNYGIRAIGKDDHSGLSLDELVQMIIENGSDKYDSNRKGVCYDQFLNYDYDIQMGTFEIKNSKIVLYDDDEQPSLFGTTVYNFYEHAPRDRGYPVRIDLLLIYDLSKLELAIPIDSSKKRHSFDKFLYKFKDRDNKKDALMRVVKILR